VLSKLNKDTINYILHILYNYQLNSVQIIILHYKSVEDNIVGILALFSLLNRNSSLYPKHLIKKISLVLTLTVQTLTVFFIKNDLSYSFLIIRTFS